jgi:HEAT repeat protein
VTTLSDEEGDVRAAAAQALGRLGAAAPGTVDDAVGPLSVALADHEVAVRRTAAEAFGRIGRESPGTVTGTIGPLVATLEDDHSTVRREGARALARIGENDPDAVVPALDSLLDALANDAHPVRAAAATALGRVAPVGDETAVLSATERLVVALDDDHDDVRESAAIAFGRLHAHDTSHDLDEEALLALGERLGVDDLDAFLYDQFTPRLDDHCPNVAVAAAFAVFRGGDTDHDLRVAARDRLEEGLAPDEWPRLTARLVAELAATGPAFHPMMREVLSPDDAEDDPAVRDLVPALVALLDSPLPDVRRHSCRALGHLGTTAARADLERVAEGDDRAAVREAAATALERLDGEDGPPEADRATADDGDTGASGPEAAGEPGARTDAADSAEGTADERDATTETSRDGPADGHRADTDPEGSDHGGAVKAHSSLADRAALYARLLEYARMESLRECRRWARELRGFVEANPVDDEGYTAARERAVALDEERLPAATSAFGEDHDIVTGDQSLADAAPELHEDIGDVAFVVRRCYVRQR